MARPLRPQWRVRTLVRRRHRTWMTSMILATCGWGLWWSVLALRRFLPAWYPGLLPVYLVTCAIAAVGLFLAVFTVRARLIWVLLAGVPILANGALLALPLVVDDQMLRLLDQSQEVSGGEARTIQMPVTAVSTVSTRTVQAILPWSMRHPGSRRVAIPEATGAR
jgi:predicted membrane metal-binding protein